MHLLPFKLLRAQLLICAMFLKFAQTDNAVGTEGAPPPACGFAFSGSAHLLKHFRHVQNHVQSMLPGLGTLLGRDCYAVSYLEMWPHILHRKTWQLM